MVTERPNTSAGPACAEALNDQFVIEDFPRDGPIAESLVADVMRYFGKCA